jgi:hypothetical protein
MLFLIRERPSDESAHIPHELIFETETGIIQIQPLSPEEYLLITIVPCPVDAIPEGGIGRMVGIGKISVQGRHSKYAVLPAGYMKLTSPPAYMSPFDNDVTRISFGEYVSSSFWKKVIGRISPFMRTRFSA